MTNLLEEKYVFPSSSRVNRVVVLLGNFKLLSKILSPLVCWMDGINSFANTFSMFFVQLTMRLLRFTKIRGVASFASVEDDTKTGAKCAVHKDENCFLSDPT